MEENVFDIPVAPKKKTISENNIENNTVDNINTEVQNEAVEMVDNSIINTSNDAENLNTQVVTPEPLPVTETAPVVEPLPTNSPDVTVTPLVEEVPTVEDASVIDNSEASTLNETTNPEIISEPIIGALQGENTEAVEESVKQTNDAVEVIENEQKIDDEIQPFAEEFMNTEIKPFEESDTMTVTETNPEVMDETNVDSPNETLNSSQGDNVVENSAGTPDPLINNDVNTNDKQVDSSNTNESINDEKSSVDPVDVPISLSSGLVVPETLDQNYGVIDDIEPNEQLKEVIEKEPKVIKKAKPVKSKKTIKKGPFIAIGCVILLALAGFLVYKFLFTGDPVTSLSKEITTFGNSITEKINKHDFINFFNSNDKMAYIFRYNNIEQNNYNLNIIGRVVKSEDKLDMTINSGDSEHSNFAFVTSIVNKDLFLKLGSTNTYYKILTLNDGFSFNNILNIEKSNIVEALTKSISKNIFANDYTKDTLRVVINGDTKFASKYVATLDNEKINNIIKDFISNLNDNSLIKKFALEEDLENIYKINKKMVIEEYITTKGLEKIVVQYRGNNLYIVKNDKGYNIVINDSELNVTNENDVIKIIGKNLNTGNTDFKHIITTTKDNNSVTIDYEYTKDGASAKTLTFRLLSQENVLFNLPSNVVDYETDEGKLKFESDVSSQKTGTMDINKVLKIINNFNK